MPHDAAALLLVLRLPPITMMTFHARACASTSLSLSPTTCLPSTSLALPLYLCLQADTTRNANVFVKNLPEDASEDDLRKHFAE